MSTATNIKVVEYVTIITAIEVDDWETMVKLQKTIVKKVSDSA